MRGLPTGEKKGLVTKPSNRDYAVEFVVRPLHGEWIRVVPENGRDVFFLQGLVNQVDKFAPESGDGVFVNGKRLYHFDSRMYYICKDIEIARSRN